MKHFNQLTPAEAERLAILLEELGEAQQAIGKILRHGYASVNPFEEGPNNRQMLERELGDVIFAIEMLTDNEDLDRYEISNWSERKSTSIQDFLHHNAS